MYNVYNHIAIKNKHVYTMHLRMCRHTKHMYRKRCPGSDHQGGVEQKNRAWKMSETLPTTGTVHTKPIFSLENGKVQPSRVQRLDFQLLNKKQDRKPRNQNQQYAKRTRDACSVVAVVTEIGVTFGDPNAWNPGF